MGPRGCASSATPVPRARHDPRTGALSQADHDAAIVAAEAAAQAAVHTRSWTLDRADTRVSETWIVADTETSFAYTQGPHHETMAVNDAPLTHDGDGRRTSDEARHIVYDALGRVVRIEDANHLVIAKHHHDPLGRWSGGSLDGQTTRRFHFGEHLLQEEDDQALVLRQATHDPAALAPLLVTDAGGRLHLHEDAGANLVLVTGTGGAPKERYRYDAFGQPTIFAGELDDELPASAVGLGPRFGGMTHLGDAGLYAAQARHYDPVTGVFLARDPNLHADSPSPYAYCGHNPISRIDPDGALWGPLLFGVFGAAANLIGLWRSGADFDAWDALVAGAIGFGAGFVGAATFGRAAAGITRGLLSVAGRSSVALGAKTSIAISVGSGAGAGLISGGVSGSFAGAAGGAYGGLRGGGEVWDLASSGAAREGVVGMAAGLVGGALFQGALRAGVLPGGTWARLHGGRQPPGRPWGGRTAQLQARGLLSPYGVGSAAIGAMSAASAAVASGLWDGGGSGSILGQAAEASWQGALLGLSLTALHPTTYQYWRTRTDVRVAAHIENAHKNAHTHHQRNVAQYPEFSVPHHRDNGALDRVNNLLTRGNLHSPDSIFASPAEHAHMHEQWRFGQRYGFTRWATHGPWSPPTDVSLAGRLALPSNQQSKK